MVSKLKIVFIGAGNLATNLAQSLFQKGFQIEQVYSRTSSSAQALAELIHAPLFTTKLDEVILGDYLYILALKDDALLTLLPQIMIGKENALVVHTAGSLPLNLLQSYTSRCGVLYPMQTFSKNRLVSFSSIPFFIEANNHSDKAYLKQMASELSSKVFEADSAQRKKLHLAAVFACNFSNHMYALSAKILNKYGLPFESMLSLIDETTTKVHSVEPKEAQTGPAARNDRDVMKAHLAMLSDMPDLQKIYQDISESIIKLKKDK